MTDTLSTTHDDLVGSMTGGMTPTPESFTPTSLLRDDARPTADFRAELRSINDARNMISVVSLVATMAATMVLAGGLGTWWATAVAFVIMALVQTRLYILHHEASHRLLFSNRRINDLVGINTLGWLPFGTGTHHYRRGHANHHRDEFGPNEPDFLLYSFYPISERSFRRKLRRDASGISAYRMLKPRLTGFMKRAHLGNSMRFLAGQFLMLFSYTLAGSPWLYFWTWLLPFFTWYQLQNRLRSIAEHGGMTRSKDRRETTHHIEQHRIARLLFTPYNVGFHLAHHVDSGVPFRNLPRLHDELVKAGYLDSASTWPNYRSFWTAARTTP